MNIKYLILALVLLACFRLVYLLTKERISFFSGLFWGGLWGVIGFFTLFTRWADQLMSFLMMENRMEFILIGGLVLLYGIVYDFSLSLKQTEQKLTKLVQALTLLEHEMEGALPAEKREGREEGGTPS